MRMCEAKEEEPTLKDALIEEGRSYVNGSRGRGQRGRGQWRYHPY